MTHRLDVARGRDIVARWCTLAEQRLEYLTQLFETGRWRRYHSEQAFLENIREARRAVEVWHVLLTREASRDNSPIDISWLGRTQVSQARGDALREQARRLQSRTTLAVQPPDVFATGGGKPIAPDEAASVTDAEMPGVDLPALNLTIPADVVELTLDVASIQERYPSLRNAL